MERQTPPSVISYERLLEERVRRRNSPQYHVQGSGESPVYLYKNDNPGLHQDQLPGQMSPEDEIWYLGQITN